MGIIDQAGATPAAVIIGLNRQERGQGELSAIQEVEQQYNIPVISIVCLDDIVTFLQESGDQAEIVASIKYYRQQYGV